MSSPHPLKGFSARPRLARQLKAVTVSVLVACLFCRLWNPEQLGGLQNCQNTPVKLHDVVCIFPKHLSESFFFFPKKNRSEQVFILCEENNLQYFNLMVKH